MRPHAQKTLNLILVSLHFKNVARAELSLFDRAKNSQHPAKGDIHMCEDDVSELLDLGVAGPAAAMITCHGLAAFLLLSKIIGSNSILRFQNCTVDWNSIFI